MKKITMSYDKKSDSLKFSNGEWVPISYLDSRNNSMDEEWRSLFMKVWFDEHLFFEAISIVEFEGKETDFTSLVFEAGRWSIYKMLCGQVDIDFITQIYIAAYLKKVQS